MDLSSGFTIGHVRGIDVRVHWSWLLIFGLLAWTLSEGLFADIFEEWSAEQRWSAGIVSTLLFFLSVLLHELSHSFVAQAYGMKVPSITLFVFGGVSSLGSEMESPQQEFRVAIAGPLMSWVLAVAFGGLWLVTTPAGVSAIFGYLAVINAALGAFNLLPGFPLDGGRVFRSMVWARSHDLMQATRVASRTGVLIAYAMIVVGLLSVFLFGLLGGLWYVLIGLFLKSASEGSYAALILEHTLEDVDVAAVMRPATEPVPATLSVQQLIEERLMMTAERAFVAEDRGAFVGMITATDLAKVAREQRGEARVGDVMIPADRVVTVTPDTGLVEGLRLMQEHDVQQLPVLDAGTIVGMLTRGDVLRRIELRAVFGPSGHEDPSRDA
jgi:Zn-dependent protease